MPKTTVVNLRTDEYDVKIGRGTRWGNPFTHLPLERTQAKYKVDTVEEAIAGFHEWATASQSPEATYIRRNAHKLRGKRLGCFCKPGPCHGDVLAWLADMRRWKPGTLVTGRLVTQHTVLYIFEDTCRDHVFELTERAARSNHGTGWVQPAKCIVCEREVAPIDIEFWQERCRGPHLRRAIIDATDMRDSINAALERMQSLVR